MRDYGIVSPRFWIGETGKKLRGNPNAQVLALYLMTSPHANMIGVFHCPILYMAHETGLDFEGASKALQSLIEAGFCTYDDPSETVFVHRMAAYQISESLKIDDKRVKGVEREWQNIGPDLLKSAFFAIYSVAFHLPKTVENTRPSEAPPKPLRSQEQEQEQEQEQPPRKRGEVSPSAEIPELPEFVDRKLWESWVQCRKGKKISAAASKIAIGQLTDWHSEGLDPNAALKNAVIGGWQGLFKPDKSQKTPPKPPSDWWSVGGFSCEAEARNFCGPSTVHQFRDGKKLEAA